MNNLSALIQEIKATGFDADGERFCIEESLTADNGWSIDISAEGYKNMQYGLLDPDDSRSTVAEVESVNITDLSFNVYDSEDSLVILSPEDSDRIHKVLSKSIG